MPSVSQKQARLMRIAAQNPDFAKKIGIDHEVAKEWYEEDKKLEAQGVSTEGRVKETFGTTPLGDFVFLGGTTNDDWREKLIAIGLEMDYFNPVVEVWSDEAKKLEDRAKEECCLQIYVITPAMIGYYSIAELVESSMLVSGGTIACFLQESNGRTWNEHQVKSNAAVVALLRKYNVPVYDNLESVAEHINDFKKAIERNDLD